MKKLLGLAVVCVLFMQMQCEDEKKEDIICIQPGCSTPATVRDYTQSGCFYMFELNDGTILEPVRIGYCGTPPMPDIPKDPLYTVDLKEGLKVVIDYGPAPGGIGQTPCAANADKTVSITCISVVKQEDDKPDTH